MRPKMVCFPLSRSPSSIHGKVRCKVLTIVLRLGPHLSTNQPSCLNFKYAAHSNYQLGYHLLALIFTANGWNHVKCCVLFPLWSIFSCIVASIMWEGLLMYFLHFCCPTSSIRVNVLGRVLDGVVVDGSMCRVSCVKGFPSNVEVRRRVP